VVAARGGRGKKAAICNKRMSWAQICTTLLYCTEYLHMDAADFLGTNEGPLYKNFSERGIRLRYSEQSGVTPVQEAIRRAKI